MSAEVTYTLSEDDLVHAFRLMGRRKNARRVLPLLYAGIAVCIVLLVLLIGSTARLFASPLLTALTGAAGILMLLLVVLLLLVPSLRRRAARATLAHNANFEGPFTVSFDEAEFRYRAPYSSAAYPWEKLHGWREDERIVVVHPAPQLFYTLPRLVLDEAALATLHAGLRRTRHGRLDV